MVFKLKKGTPFLYFFVVHLIYFVFLWAAIETYKQQLSGTTTEYNLNAQSDECSDDDEHTSSDVPILEEFIPLKRTFSHEYEDQEDAHDEENESHKSKNNNSNNSTISKDNKSNTKSDWLRSVQLWNQTSDPTLKEVIDFYYFLTFNLFLFFLFFFIFKMSYLSLYIIKIKYFLS